MQDCGISIALAMEIPQSCTKPKICDMHVCFCSVSVLWNKYWQFYESGFCFLIFAHSTPYTYICVFFLWYSYFVNKSIYEQEKMALAICDFHEKHDICVSYRIVSYVSYHISYHIISYLIMYHILMTAVTPMLMELLQSWTKPLISYHISHHICHIYDIIIM